MKVRPTSFAFVVVAGVLTGSLVYSAARDGGSYNDDIAKQQAPSWSKEDPRLDVT